MRFVRVSLLIMIGLGLAGCTAPNKGAGVLNQLPDPVVQRWPHVVPSPAPPRPPAHPKPQPRVVRPEPRQVEPTPRVTSRSLEGVHIVVDPGHGGKDPGASSRHISLPEKKIVLSIANELTKELRARGARVTQTRTSDKYISLEQRARVAEKTRADMLVSIHADAAANTSANGIGLFIARNASKESRYAAIRMHRTLKSKGFECRAIQRKGFIVLVGHSRPSMLIETGFMSNRNDALALAKSAHRSRVAKAIADGLDVHFKSQ